jgi:hypothetical protein
MVRQPDLCCKYTTYSSCLNKTSGHGKEEAEAELEKIKQIAKERPRQIYPTNTFTP